MLKNIFLILATSVFLFAANLSTYEAKNHIGEVATICGTVVSGYYARNSRGEPTFLNMDKPYPNQPFTIVIWGEDRMKFGDPLQKYKGHHVCVEGFIDSYRGIPQIVARDPSQILGN